METGTAIYALSALAHESRLTVFRLLVEAGRDGLAAGQLAERLEVPPATMSFHLAHLDRAGLVSSRRDGRSIIYAADYATMNGLVAYLTENCCRGAAAAPQAGCSPAACSPDLAQQTGDLRHEAPARARRR